MSDKLDRFTKTARHTLTVAHTEALRLNHDLIGTEHMLLALDAEPAQVIRAVERTVDRQEVIFRLDSSE